MSVASDEAAHNEEKIEAVNQGTGSNVCGARVAKAPGEQAAAQIGDEHDTVGKGGIEVIECCAQDDDRDAVGHQVFPTAVQEWHGEDAPKSPKPMWDKPITVEVEVPREVDYLSLIHI